MITKQASHNQSAVGRFTSVGTWQPSFMRLIAEDNDIFVGVILS